MTMVDTNVLVRIITNDDHSQAVQAAAFLRSQDRVFVWGSGTSDGVLLNIAAIRA